MIIQKADRYRKQRDKLNSNKTVRIVDGAEVKKNMGKEYTNFNIRPGMMTWTSMPEDYKRAYNDQQKVIEEIRAKEGTLTAANIASRQDRLKKERELNNRVKQMEKRLLFSKKQATDYINTKKKAPKEVHLDNAVCNFVDSSFFTTRAAMVDQQRRTPIKDNRKKILLITDVCGWAWWNKSRYIQMYLKDEFDIDIICTLGPEAKGINRGRYDLYFTYGYSYVGMLQAVDISKRITGITAHRPPSTIKAYMGLAGNLHANSRMLFDELKGLMGHDRIFYVPNGVDEQLFKPIKPIGDGEKLVAGHVGKKCDAKGQSDFIIPAMRGADVESIYNMSDYRNRRPYCEMYEYYQDMDVFVVASIEDGTPNGALEAAACGRPIISNRIGNMPEFIIDGYNGFLLDHRDVNAYIEKLNLLNNDRKLLKKMGRNARKTVEANWTWKKQSNGYRQMFRKILN